MADTGHFFHQTLVILSDREVNILLTNFVLVHKFKPFFVIQRYTIHFPFMSKRSWFSFFLFIQFFGLMHFLNTRLGRTAVFLIC